MCGLLGIVNFKNGSIEHFPLEKMTNTISHRGPDDYGYYNDTNVRFGFRRLSIIDIELGHQPLITENGNYIIIFNGEIYNFKEVRSKLLSEGYKFNTKTDTEVIVHAFDLWGKDCVNEFNGMFAFAIYDKCNKEVFIARDRMGIKPLYYAFIGETIIFASEIKAIIEYEEFKREADLKAISSYLTFRYSFGERTFFNGISKLLPGHSMTINKNNFSIKKYWSIPFHDTKEDKGEKYYLDKTRELLKNAVERRLISDVPLGALLSGGLDSSIVVALMAKINEDKVSTYSIGFDKKGYDESEYAEIVANHFNTNHTSLILNKEDYINDLREMIIQKDAPLSIPHEIALNKISKKLKEYTTVVISGEGADELFGGYGRVQRSPHDYKKIRFINNYIPGIFKNLLFRIMGAGPLSKKWSMISNKIDYFFSVYNWVPFEEKWSLFEKSTLEKINYDKDLIDFWKKDFEKTNQGNEYDQILYMFQKNHLICLLDRLDGMTMAASVEARVPFVDHELIEFISSIPIKYKLKWKSNFSIFKAIFSRSFDFSEKFDISKYMLRKIGLELLPKIIPYRKKKGFPVPLDNWINDGLIEYAKEILLDEKSVSRNIFKQDEIKRLINNQQKLDYDFWGKKIWMLINIEIWYREFID